MSCALPDKCNVRCDRRDDVDLRVRGGAPGHARAALYRTNATCAAIVATRSSHACRSGPGRTRELRFTGQMQRALQSSRRHRPTRVTRGPNARASCALPDKRNVRGICRDKVEPRGWRRYQPAGNLETQPVPFSRSEQEGIVVHSPAPRLNIVQDEFSRPEGEEP